MGAGAGRPLILTDLGALERFVSGELSIESIHARPKAGGVVDQRGSLGGRKVAYQTRDPLASAASAGGGDSPGCPSKADPAARRACHTLWSLQCGGGVRSVAWAAGCMAVAGDVELEVFDVAGLSHPRSRGIFPRSALHVALAARGVRGEGGGLLMSTAGEDGAVRLWDADTGAEIRAWGAGETNGTVLVWKVSSGARVAAFPPKVAAHGINSVAFSLDGARVVSACANGVVRVCSVAEQSCLLSLHGHEGQATCCTVSPDGKRIASSSGDGTARVWDVESGECLAALGSPGALPRATACAFSPLTRDLAVAYEDGVVRVWPVDGGVAASMEGGGQVLSWAAHSRAVAALCFGDDASVLSCSRQGHVHFFALNKPQGMPEAGC